MGSHSWRWKGPGSWLQVTCLSFQVMGAYYSSIASPGSRGAAFLAVCRGKVSSKGLLLPTGAHDLGLGAVLPLGSTSSKHKLGGQPPDPGWASRGGHWWEGQRSSKNVTSGHGVLEVWALARAWPRAEGLSPDCPYLRACGWEGLDRPWGRLAGLCGACR